MMYRCDECGCYLDPGEGRICDECRRKMERKEQRAKVIGEAVRLSDNDQYEIILQEVG